MIYDGQTRSEAARHGGVSLQTIRDWVLRFNARGPEGLVDDKSTGAPPRLNAEQRTALAQAVETGPIPYIDGVVRWRLCDLVAWLHDKYDVTVDATTVGRALKDMGYAKLTARPRHHAQDPEAPAAFKKTFPPTWRKSRPGCRPARP